MKVRNGFVSNSSSSSFIIMTTKDNHEKALQTLHPFVKAVIDEMGITKSKFNGEDVVSLGYMNVMDSGWTENLSVDYEGDIPKGEYGDKMDYSEAFDTYCEAIRKDKDKVFESSSS